MRRHWIRLIKIGLAVTVFITGFGQAVLQLWNHLMPGIFGLPRVSFWQAVGLLALSWILFGSWRGLGSWGGRRHWRRRMIERWEQMTPEERERFRQGVIHV